MYYFYEHITNISFAGDVVYLPPVEPVVLLCLFGGNKPKKL